MLIIVICLLMENKYLNLKLTIKMLFFQLNFVSEVYLMDLVLVSLEKPSSASGRTRRRLGNTNTCSHVRFDI